MAPAHDIESIEPSELIYAPSNSWAPIITAANTFRAGQTINFAGAAVDLEDGLIPASNMTWEVVLHHNIHTHPHVAPFSGVNGGSFMF